MAAAATAADAVTAPRGTYRAIQLNRFARSFDEATNIVSLPIRPPGPGEITVRNLHCGINGIFDTQICRNAVDYVTLSLPALMGVEAIGLVEAVGDGVSTFKPGDAAISVRFGGGYCEWNTAQAEQFAAAPSADRAWLALASTGVSAWLALEHVGQISNGETVAISAAAGGLGHFLVQLAKQRGCRVVAVCSGGEKAALVRELGADTVIDYRTQDVAAALASIFGDAIDLAIDTVGGAIFDAFLDNLAPLGRLVVGGAASDLEGRPEPVTGPRVAHTLYFKAASVRGFMNGRLTQHWPAARARMFELYEAGRLRVVFDHVQFNGLDGVYGAVGHLLSGRSFGKVVVQLQ